MKIRKQILVGVVNGNLAPTLTQALLEITAAGSKHIDNIQNIGIAWEALDFGDIGTLGEVALQNLDAINYVELALANDGLQIFAVLRPSAGAAVIPLATKTVYAKAHTGACDVALLAAEQ